MAKEKASGIFPKMQVIIAALNEEDGIGLTIAELKEYLSNPRILMVDGKSSDNTVHVAKSLGADVLFQKGEGKGDAIDYALRNVDTDHLYVVMTDADYTYPADYVPKMIKLIDENPNVGMVCGNRFSPNLGVDAMKSMFHFGNKAIALMHYLMNGVSMKDPLTGLRVMRWRTLKNWKPQSDGFDIEVELNSYIKKLGYLFHGKIA